MDQKRLDQYNSLANPLFGYNVISRLDDEDPEPDVTEETIHRHQIGCYMRLFELFQQLGISIPEHWQIPKLTNHANLYHSILPVLSDEVLSQFETWLSELSKADAELTAQVVINELTNLKIINEESYSSGINLRKAKGFGITEAVFKFVARGNIIKVSQAEIYNVGGLAGHGSQIMRAFDSKDLTNRLMNLVGSLELRISRLNETLNNVPTDENKILELVKNEISERGGRFLDEHADKAIRRIGKTCENAASELDKISKSTENKYFKDLKTIQDNLENTRIETDQIVNSIEERTKTVIESVASGFKTEGALKAAFNLWEKKEKLHRKMFFMGIGIFTGTIFVILCLVWYFSDNILSLENTIFATPSTPASGETTGSISHLISRIILITLPLGIGVWVLRAILRWANLNLSLAEDAAQRSVMAQTYVNLLKNGDVTEDKDDRKIMLEAIFRPLPGIQEMDTAPPSIINFANPNSKPK